MWLPLCRHRGLRIVVGCHTLPLPGPLLPSLHVYPGPVRVSPLCLRGVSKAVYRAPLGEIPLVCDRQPWGERSLPSSQPGWRRRPLTPLMHGLEAALGMQVEEDRDSEGEVATNAYSN